MQIGAMRGAGQGWLLDHADKLLFVPDLGLLQYITNKSFSFINIIGGGARDKLMCHFTADACHLPVAAGLEEATALGNIIVQLIAAGEIKSLEEGRNIIANSFPAIWYEPNDDSIWEEQYQKYCELFPIYCQSN